MDCLDWAGLQVAGDTSASWQNSDSNCLLFPGGKISNISEDILNSIQILHKMDPSHGNSYSDKSISHMFQHVGPALDQGHVNSNWNIRQAIKLADENDDDDDHQICSTKLNKTEFIVNQLNGVSADYGMGEVGVVTGSRSVESLDCLLSGTNSNTADTSIEDDGISVIFSDWKSLWNFRAGNAISSGELSGCDSSYNGKESNKYKRVKEIDDQTVSQTSSDQYANQTKKRSETMIRPGPNYQSLDLHQQSDSSTAEDGFQLISEDPPKPKKPRSEKCPSSSNINFQQPTPSVSSAARGEPDSEAIAQMKEMIYRAAAFRPVNFGTEAVEKPKRKNVRISSDPQTVAARQRRERISERIRVLQRLVPGGSKMDTASMLDEAANYLKFLRSQVKALEALGQQKRGEVATSSATHFPFPSLPFNHSFPMQSCFPLQYPNSIYQPKN